MYMPGDRRDHYVADLELSRFATVFIKDELAAAYGSRAGADPGTWTSSPTRWKARRRRMCS